MTETFSDSFLDAVIDSLLPGETDSAGGTPLPAATGAGLAGRSYGARHAAVLAAIGREAGGEQAFAGAAAAQRKRVLEAVEQSLSGPFRALVQELVADYHERPQVLAAYGWRAEPPQPLGHRVEAADAAAWAGLDKVKARGPIWRVAP
ncbi:MAG: hypothetical protein J0H01_03935 [Rhizobiales bacterium]|nr:hypothetical protein [Hyphomicrobiales bacterium]